MLDADELIYQLIRPGIPEGGTLKPDLEVKSMDSYPFWTFRGIGGDSLYSRGSMRPKAWNWQLYMNLFHDDYDEARDLAGAFYDFMHSFNEESWSPTPPNVVPGLGHAQEVTDVTLFSKTAEAALPGHTVVQLTGAFAFQLHQA